MISSAILKYFEKFELEAPAISKVRFLSFVLANKVTKRVHHQRRSIRSDLAIFRTVHKIDYIWFDCLAIKSDILLDV